MVSHSDSPRALITGIRGFTGNYLAKELEFGGFHVFGTAHGLEQEGDRIFRVDLCDRDDVVRLVNEVRPTVVVHLAAISFVSHDDVDSIYRVNVVGTRNLLMALANLEIKPRSVLLASSANIYGNSDADIINESIIPKPENDYGVSKYAMECMARLWLNRLPIVIVRPFNYTGVGQGSNFLIPKIVSSFKLRQHSIELGNTYVERDFSDVRMIVQAYRKLLDLSPAGEVFNVCSGVVYKLRDVIAMMESIAGYKINVIVNPDFVRENEVKRLQGNSDKLVELVGPLKNIGLYDTLKWMYDNC